jgi:hypothetical protein
MSIYKMTRTDHGHYYESDYWKLTEEVIEVEAAKTELEIQQRLIDMGWTPPVEDEWDYWVGKSVYSFLFDKVFEVTSLESDDWDRPLLHCEEKIEEHLYEGGELFHLFEIKEL